MQKIFFSLYNILFIALYCLTIPFIVILVKSKVLPPHILEYYGFIDYNDYKSPSIWFHCASIGEIKSIKTLTNELKRQCPLLNIIITTTTIGGKKIAQREIENAAVFLLPVENVLAIYKIIKKFDVKLLIIVETELWPNLINTAAKYCTLYLINARLSQKSYKKYKALSVLFKRLLNKFNKIFAKSAFDKKLIASISQNHVEYIGDLKLINNSINTDKKIVNTFLHKKCLFLASTHSGEEDLFIKNASTYIDRFDYIFIAPRHIDRIKEIEGLLKRHNLSYSLFSKDKTYKKFILIDLFGLMDTFYSIADKIFIGGSLVNVGGHNIYEALRLKKIISTGPNMDNFADIYKIALSCGVLHLINSIEEFVTYLNVNNNTDGAFNKFFSIIDKNNKNVLNNLIGLIKNDIENT